MNPNNTKEIRLHRLRELELELSDMLGTELCESIVESLKSMSEEQLMQFRTTLMQIA